MKKFVLLAAAAAFLTPALMSAASAETLNVRVGVGNSGYHNGYRAYGQERVYVGHRNHCRTVVTRHKRDNGTVVIRKIRRCD